MEIKYINGEYKIIGEFDYGFAGKFVNDENGNGNISLDLTEEDFEELKVNPADTKKVIKKMTKNINYFQSIVLKKNKNLKNHYILNVFETMLRTVDIFWDGCVTIKEYKDEKYRAEIDKAILSFLEEKEDTIDNILEAYVFVYESKLKNKLAVDIENQFREIFKFYDFDMLLSSVKPEKLVFGADYFDITLANAITDKHINPYSVIFDKNLQE